MSSRESCPGCAVMMSTVHPCFPGCGTSDADSQVSVQTVARLPPFPDVPAPDTESQQLPFGLRARYELRDSASKTTARPNRTQTSRRSPATRKYNGGDPQPQPTPTPQHRKDIAA
jgi:hypothetical protein